MHSYPLISKKKKKMFSSNIGSWRKYEQPLEHQSCFVLRIWKRMPRLITVYSPPPLWISVFCSIMASGESGWSLCKASSRRLGAVEGVVACRAQKIISSCPEAWNLIILSFSDHITAVTSSHLRTLLQCLALCPPQQWTLPSDHALHTIISL